MHKLPSNCSTTFRFINFIIMLCYVHLDQPTLSGVLRRVQILQVNTAGRVVQGVESQEAVACYDQSTANSPPNVHCEK